MDWYLLFFLSLAFILYTYIAYPLLVWVAARAFGRRVRKAPYEPTLTLIIPVHNERDNIARKLDNVLSCQYPRERIELLVVSDASTDGTDELLREAENEQLKLLSLPQRSGKAAAMNAAAHRARGDILVFMDARQQLEPDALRAITSNFSDPSVGLCTGELSLLSEGGTAQALSLYWRYERWIRRSESRLHATFGATGALMAMRRELFSDLDPETILDDVVLPLRTIAAGFRSIHEPEARLHDAASQFWAQESRRKVRTLAGNFQLIFHPRRMANPFTPRTLVQFVSHKLLRLLIPPALVCLLVSSVLIPRPVYRAFAVGQVLFYLFALDGWLAAALAARPRFVTFPYVFTNLQIAVVRGFFRYVTGKEKGRW